MIHLLGNTYAVIDPWFSRDRRPIELDMGCGKGRFTIGLAQRFPDRLVLGSDVMLGRLRKVEGRAARLGLANVELLRTNSLELVGFQLPDSCIRRLHLLCPDPWPKTRHRWHRLVTSDFLTRVARILEPGGILHFSTDHEPYLEEVRVLVERLGLFGVAGDSLADIADLKTDFELTWLEDGREVPHLAYACLKGLPK